MVRISVSSQWVTGRHRHDFFLVKGIYVSWANDPPNTKIKDWNVTELKVGGVSLASRAIPDTVCLD